MARNRKSRPGIRIHRSYTVEEAARCLGAAKGTIRRWIKCAGLPALSAQKPILILGSDLVEFLARSKPPRQPCQFDECYCLKCREPRRPAGGMVDLIPTKSANFNMRGLCPECGSWINKRIRCDAIPALEQAFSVSIAGA